MIYLIGESSQIFPKMDGYFTKENGILIIPSLKGLDMSNVFNFVGASVEGLSLEEATQRAGMNWNVSKRFVYVTDISDKDNTELFTTNKFFATTRDDTNQILGIVGPDYQVVQNNELAYMCERLQGSDVKIETAGILDNGRRVFIQMRGNAFDVGPKKDTNIPYTLFTNGHDGQWPLSSLPTSVRVICENTLNMALQSGSKSNMIISVRHTGNMQDRLESMFQAIENWKDRTLDFQTKIESLARKEVNTEFVQNFWTNLYMNLFGNIHNSPSSETQQEENKVAYSTVAKWSNVFDSEVKLSGANLWTAANAVTSWLDHGQIYRGIKKNENRFNDTLFGSGAKEKIRTMNYALSAI